MGFFGTYLYDADGWRTIELTEEGPDAFTPPYLWLTVHDSDIAQLSYAPAGDATGTAFLGDTPRTYFEDDTASEPTDVAREAAGLAAWVLAVTGSLGPAPSEIEPWLAADDQPLPGEDQVLTDVDVFVELKAARFLEFLGLGLPADLR